MTHLLDILYSVPLEREYEAWICRSIEEYFTNQGSEVHIWAVSPREEVYWPADEKVLVGKKLFGLQMKKPVYKNTSQHDFGRLNWLLHSPSGQFGLVRKTPEIYYCLPTFTNRRFSRTALDHCLFWRPPCDDKNAWYDNPNARTPHKAIKGAARWGYFIEQVVSCSIGKRINSNNDLRSFSESLKQMPPTGESDDGNGSSDSDKEEGAVRLFLVDRIDADA